MKIILGSGSPRRKELLEQIGMKFQVITSNTAEKFDDNLSPQEVVKLLSEEKAVAVASLVKEDSIIIGADTIVVIDNKILGKPKDEEDAYKILDILSGKKHKVITGVTVVKKTDDKIMCLTKYEETSVYMAELSKRDICEYIKTREPMDKAGAYGIQGKGALLVEKIEGDYFNIVGLPLYLLKNMLNEMGYYF